MVKDVEKINRLKRFLIHIFGVELGTKRFLSLMRSSSLKVLKFKYGKMDGQRMYDELILVHKYKNTLPAFIERYGNVDGPTKYYEKNKKLSVSVESLKLNGFSDDDIVKIRNRHSNGSKTDRNSMIHKYGTIEGERRYKQKMKNFFTHWDYKSVMRVYNMDEVSAKLYVKNVQRRDLKYYTDKYGEIEGVIKYDSANKKRAYANTKEYYIEKYGETEGISKYNDLRVANGKTGRLSYYVEKYGELDGEKKYAELIQKKVTYFPNFSSNIEIQFNTALYNMLDDTYKPFFYGNPITEKPYYLNVDSKKYGIKCIVPDVKIKNIIVEFDGDYWHSLDVVKERDTLKNKIYRDYDYFLIRIKECDYIKNSNTVIQDTINMIKENIKI